MSGVSLRAAGVRTDRIALMTADLDALSLHEAISLVQGIEAAGVGTLWFGEILGREAFTVAQACLAETDQLLIACGVARALERAPKNAAAAQATLWEGYRGRFLLSLGVSSAVRRERGVAPLPFLTEYLAAMDATLDHLGASPRPPRLLGGYSEQIMRLAARAADGLVTTIVPPTHTAWARQLIGPEAFLATYQWVVGSAEPSVTRGIGHARLAYYLGLPHQLAKFRAWGFDDDDLALPGSDRLVDACVVWGSPAMIAARCAEHLAAGADQVAICVLGPPSPAKLETFIDLANEFGQPLA